MIRIFNNEDDKWLSEHYAQLGANECAKRLDRGLSARQVSSRVTYLRKIGKTKARVSGDTMVSLLARPKPPRPEKVGCEQFLNPSRPEIAYVLGLLWADGCVYVDPVLHVNKVMINLVAEDLTSVESVFDVCGTWSKYITPKKTGKTQRTFVANGKNLCSALGELGYRSKAGRPFILDRLPDSLRPYWFRGLMDGDGCFYIGKYSNGASVCGPKEQDWTYLTDVLNKLSIDYRVRVTGSPEKGGTRSAVYISNLRSVVRWGEFIYQDFAVDGIGFPRKWEKYQQLKNRYENSNWWKHYLEREDAA